MRLSGTNVQKKARHPMIVLPQLFMIFFIAGVGAVLRKRQVLTDPVVKGVSDIVTLATNPALLIAVTQHEYTHQTLTGFLHVLWMSTVTMAAMLVMVYLICRRQSEMVRPIISLVAVMPNAGFMGLPIIQAVYGDLGALYLAAVLVAFNLVFWTVGIALIDRSGFSLKGMFNPGFIAALAGTALFLMRVKLPTFLYTPLNTLGTLNTPLAMLILGARMTSFSPKGLLDWKNALVSFVKLFAMPLITLGLARLFSLDGAALGALVVSSAMPSGILSQMIAEQYRRDALFAAQEISFTSLLCILTIPLVVMILGR
jgi:predicted permease